MTRPIYDKTTQLPRTQERRRQEIFVSWDEGEGGLYSSGEENMNGRPFNES